jgi:hypothetical protein
MKHGVYLHAVHGRAESRSIAGVGRDARVAVDAYIDIERIRGS